jgi:Fur family ferric uptake transcriptional regulator
MNEIQDILKKAGLKATPIRSAVLDILIKSNHALHQNFIESKLENLDIITLYRTLKSFEEKGLVHKITDTNAVVKYASCKPTCLEHHHHYDNHIHFECESCKNTFCLEESEVPHLTIPEKYKVTSVNITMKGKCEKCQ